MKIVAIFAALLAVSLAAPTELETVPEKAVTAEKTVVSEKLVETDEVVSQLSDTPNKDKVDVKPEVVVEEKLEKPEEKVKDEVKDKVEAEVALVKSVIPDEVTIPKEDEPVVPVTASADKEKTDEEKLTEEEVTEHEKNVNESSAICRASTGATLEQVTAISNEPVDDAPREVKCYVKCIAEQLKVVKDQVLQKDVALELKSPTLAAEELDSAADDCASLQTDDPCDSSYLRYSCYFRTSGKKIRII